MYSVIVGCSPQTGHSGSRRSATSVNAVDDHVPALGEDPLDVLRGQLLLEGLDLDIRVQLPKATLRGIDLRLPQGGGRVEHLALEVRLVDDVRVDDAECPDTGGREIER